MDDTKMGGTEHKANILALIVVIKTTDGKRLFKNTIRDIIYDNKK